MSPFNNGLSSEENATTARDTRSGSHRIPNYERLYEDAAFERPKRGPFHKQESRWSAERSAARPLQEELPVWFASLPDLSAKHKNHATMIS
jgi:hypothetical protein